MKFFSRLLDLIYPKGLTCISCEKELTDNQREYALCDKCKTALKKVDGEIKLSEGISVYSCFHYDDIARQLVLSYKDSDKPYISEYMAKFIRDKYIEKGLNSDGIVFVPSSTKKINRRGYDALKQVAKHLSDLLNIPVISALKKKNVDTDLTKVAKEKRAEMVAGTFYLDNSSCLEGKNILLIDDIITTGATLRECIETMKNAKLKNVDIITFTRALQ